MAGYYQAVGSGWCFARAEWWMRSRPGVAPRARCFLAPRLKLTRGMSVPGTSVWTGRALQVGYDGLEIVGLAHLYSAL